ncbi:MAG: SprT-like domain-containing protein [Rhodothermales bacterium]|nr:SprT-like domain-containing protein [Rhodothermales bacterium]
MFGDLPGGTRLKRLERSRLRSSTPRRSGSYGLQLSLDLGGRERAAGHGANGRSDQRATVVSTSVRRIRPYLPPGAEPLVVRLLREVPTDVVPVEARESKHGDFTIERGKSYGRITVNVCGNRYRFLLTLLHELAHSRVAMQYRRRVRPHGPEWKNEFSRLLFRLLRYQILTPRLRRAVYLHALSPKSTDEYDTELQLALRRFDTLDKRLTVVELEEGTRFSLDGGLVLRRGKMLRRRIQCRTPDGQVYTVLPAARVDTVFDR